MFLQRYINRSRKDVYPTCFVFYEGNAPDACSFLVNVPVKHAMYSNRAEYVSCYIQDVHYQFYISSPLMPYIPI